MSTAKRFAQICARGISSMPSLMSPMPQVPTMNIFDRNAKVKQRARASDAVEPNVCNYIREEIGWRLADRIFDIKRTFKNAADIGCFRGHVSKHLDLDNVENLMLCDTNQHHLDEAEVPAGVKVTKRIMDEENIDFEPESLDLIMSSLCLHWVNDLPGCFDKIITSLKNDGAFMATLFGEDTLYELRSSLQLADLERKGGIAPHISPFARIRDIGGLLNRSGFTLQTIDTDELVVGYPSMFELMLDLKGMGESNCAFSRQLHLTRDTQFAAASIYEDLYGKVDENTKEKSIPATFQVIYLLGWKPDVSQPKPLKRGSGNVSLKDLHKLDEVAVKTGEIQLPDEDERKK